MSSKILTPEKKHKREVGIPVHAPSFRIRDLKNSKKLDTTNSARIVFFTAQLKAPT